MKSRVKTGYYTQYCKGLPVIKLLTIHKNTIMRYRSIIHLLPALCLLLFSCQQNKGQKAQDNKLSSSLEKIEQQKGTFNPAYFKDTNNAHLAITVNYSSNNFVVVPGQATLRPGRPPYLAGDTAKEFVVRYRDAAGKIVGSYSFNNPGLVQACEVPRPGISIQGNIRFDVLVPANKNIASIEISNKGRTLTRFAVPAINTNPRDTTNKRPNRLDTLKQ
jgi:hypothetical protein